MRPIRSALNRIHHPAILAAGLVLAVAIPVEMGAGRPAGCHANAAARRRFGRPARGHSASGIHPDDRRPGIPAL